MGNPCIGNDLPVCKTAKVICINVNQKYTRFLQVHDRKDCRKMVAMLTGHSLVAVHDYRRPNNRETMHNLFHIGKATFQTFGDTKV